MHRRNAQGFARPEEVSPDRALQLVEKLIAKTGIGTDGRGNTGLFHVRMGMYNLGWP